MSFIFFIYSSKWLEAPFTAHHVTRFLRVRVGGWGRARPPLGVDLRTRPPSSLSLPGDDFGRSFSPRLDLPSKTLLECPPDLCRDSGG